MEFWLSVDLSTALGSLSLHQFDPSKKESLTCITESSLGEARRHTEAFLPTLNTQLKSAGLNFSDLSLFLTSIGPGSFTGLRIALASLKGFLLATQKPIETFRNSEIRLLAHLNGHAYRGNRAMVLTQVSATKISVETFSRQGSEKWVLESENVVEKSDLQEENCLWLHEPSTFEHQSHGANAIHYVQELRAADLANFRFQSLTRRSFQLTDWNTLTPLYFGSKF